MHGSATPAPVASRHARTAPLLAIAQWLAAHPGLASLALGLVAATGFPPLRWWPLTLVALGLFALMVARAPTLRAAAWRGWLFGLAHFTLANNWIAQAFTYQEEMPAALGWLAVPLLSVYLAVYPMIATLAAWWLARRTRATALTFGVLLGACWTIAEWLRSWVFTGYAWDPLGLALLGDFTRPGIAALLPFIGTYALSGLTVFLGAALVVLAVERRWRVLALLSVLIAAAMLWPAPAGREGTVPFTLIQPDIRQEVLDDPANFERQFARSARLSAPLSGRDRRLILWPESGVADYLEPGYPQSYYNRNTAAADPGFARFRLGRVVGEGSTLLTGVVELEMENGRALGARNAVNAIDGSGETVARYYKAHLVPYGEYLALRWLFEPLGLTRLVAGTLDFLPGPGPRTIDTRGFGGAGVQICYEIIFSGQVVDRGNRPDFLFNPSNDGWFGAFGPPQHLAQARMRAIEEGLPVLRSTTTGISAVIDARGVVREHLPMHVAGRIDGAIPPPAPPTLFARLSNALPLALAVMAILACLLVSRRARG